MTDILQSVMTKQPFYQPFRCGNQPQAAKLPISMAFKHASLHLKTPTSWLVKKNSLDGTTKSATLCLMDYNVSYEEEH